MSFQNVIRWYTFPYVSAHVAPVDTAQRYGGNGGLNFDDASSWENRNITAIRLTCGQYVVSIQVRYGDEWGIEHGRGIDVNGTVYGTCPNTGQSILYTLSATEYIHTIVARHDRVLDSITFITNDRTLPSCGSNGGSEKTVTGTRLMYIFGRKGCVVDALQPHWALE